MMPPAWFFLAFLLVAIAMGAIVGALVASSVAARIVKQWIPPFPEFIAVEKVTLTSVVTDQDGMPGLSQQISVTPPEISSIYVERWLDKRNLMMTPKGKEFTVPHVKQKDLS